MKMGRIEKWFMNRPHHAKHIISRAERLLQLVRLEEKQKYLEIGCGNGALSNYMAEKYRLNVTAIDVDPEQIELAKSVTKSIQNIRFKEANATQLPFQNSEFDIVLSFGVMHHIPNWRDALDEIGRVLKAKGYFMCFDIIQSEWIAKIGKIFKNKYGIITIREFNSFIMQNNFSTIYSTLPNTLIFNHFNAVYQKN
jgi:ubiquinone/menaquinone biosynthesis C-methylase UbiE